MSLTLRIVLIIASVLTFIFVSRKLKKSEIDIADSAFWIVLSFFFIIISVFPKIVSWGAQLMGFETPVNFVFLVVIAILLLRLFTLDLKVKKLETKNNNLVQEIALREKSDYRH